jgi:hypothetical protein
MLHTFPEHELCTTDFFLWNLRQNQCMNILHAMWKSMHMHQIDDHKNQKFDEIVHLMQPMYTRSTKVHNCIVISGIGRVIEQRPSKKAVKDYKRP